MVKYLLLLMLVIVFCVCLIVVICCCNQPVMIEDQCCHLSVLGALVLCVYYSSFHSRFG